MDENKMEGMEPDTIIFEDEDGNEYEFEVRDYFFYNGDEYSLLTEVGQEEDENGEETLVTIDDDDEFERASEAFESEYMDEIDMDDAFDGEEEDE